MTGTILDAYSWQAERVVAESGADVESGLSRDAAAERLVRLGPNTLPAAVFQGPLIRFLLQFHSPLIYVLLACMVVSAFIGARVDAGVILAVVMVNAVVGFAQETRAEHALETLAAMTRTFAIVVRDGVRLCVPSAEVVPGDLVVLAAGDKVPADLRLVQAAELAVDESALTGESVPVLKDPADLPPGTSLADRHNMVYSATLVTYGGGLGIVVATGARTELGAIHRLIGTAEGIQTPLTRKLTRFSTYVTVAILVLAAVTFGIGLLRGQPVTEMLTAAVALAVGAIPEGLPAVVTVTLAFGTARMVGRHAIIRKLPAVETLGSTTVICTDKTGTLTENQMTVTVIAAAGQIYEVTGTGYSPDGTVRLGGSPVRVTADRALGACLMAGLACNDARLVSAGDGWNVTGDPTEGALLASAAKAGPLSPPARIDTVPFTSERRYMATLHEGGAIYVKGSVEQVLALCAQQIGADGRPGPLNAPGVLTLAEDLGARALRVLAFATARAEPGTEELGGLPALTFVGLQAMHDPPRETAAAAVRACLDAGIQVKMITGDHAATARAIGDRMGLTGPVMTGAQLAACPDEELPSAAERTTVFARVSPEQKLRLVRALQSSAHVVAMTGDGVNDAPALKQADIGVAMGNSGTEVARQSADMVLTDDDFASIEAAVQEGRGVFDNLVKFIVWAMPANAGIGLVLVAAIVAGTVLPILPVQALWLNMTAVLVLGLPFAVEPGDPDVMRRPPRDPSAPLIGRVLTGRILLVSAILVAGSFGLFHWELAHETSLSQARTAVVNVFAVILLAYMFNCLSLNRPLLWRGLRRNPWFGVGALALIAIQLVFTYVPAMNHVFGSAPLDGRIWLQIIALALVSYTAVELAKWFHRPREH